MVVINLMTIPITIIKAIKVTQVIAVSTVVHPVETAPGTLGKFDEIQGIHWTRMTVDRRKYLLYQQLDLSGLDKWSDGNQAAAQALLAEYHDNFFLEPRGFSCADLVKHEIMVVDDEPFKEKFPRILPLMVDEVHAHVMEILEVGAIHPNQSTWGNVVVLVCKTDWGLYFCIDIHKLNARTKKDSYPLPQIQKAIESLVRAGCFFCLIWIMGNLGFFERNACHSGCAMPMPLFKG